MDPHALEKLEFDRIRNALAGLAGSALGRNLAQRVEPSNQPATVRRWLDEVRQMESAVDQHGPPAMAGMRDLTQHLADAAKPAGLEPEALADVAETFLATGLLRKWLTAVEDVAPLIARFADKVCDLSVPGATISAAIDPRGGVRDEASPKLASIRGTIDRSRARITEVVNRLLKQSRILRMLQYPNATFHDDRMVLPLKAEHRGRIPGIIHRSSDTGSTLFVEPSEAVDLNNAIVRLRIDEQKEITRILQQLSRLVHENDAAVRDILRATARVDLISAKYKFSRQWNCICPAVREDGITRLYGARHPLLMMLFATQGGDPPKKVVPIDVRLGDDFDLLVITGPNTGGKTVAIKTFGLLVLMTQSGIPIPAAQGSEVAVYGNVFIDIGDEQSLEQSLSTFSAHVTNILHILRNARAGHLALIDELGAGTDPDEGAAISRAVIEELLANNVHTIVSTHLSTLKGIAFSQPRADNASVEFDIQTLRPTYRLLMGEPGNSNAITIASRLGMSPELVGRAKRHLDSSHHHLQAAIDGTIESRRKAESARLAAVKARFDADQREQEFEDQRKQLAEAHSEYEDWVKWINRLEPGDNVYVKSMDKIARVVRVELHRQRALVSAGALDVDVNLKDLAQGKHNDKVAK